LEALAEAEAERVATMLTLEALVLVQELELAVVVEIMLL
jgi:hypothetical protein